MHPTSQDVPAQNAAGVWLSTQTGSHVATAVTPSSRATIRRYSMLQKSGMRRRRKERPIRYLVYAIFFALLVTLGTTIHLYTIRQLSQNNYLVYASMAQSLLFSFVVLAYLFARRDTIKQALQDLGLSRRSWGFRYILYGVGLFAAIFLLEIIISAFQAITGVQLPTNVTQIFSGLPFWFLLFSVIVVPVNEEILFRGFLVPKIGATLISALRKPTRQDYTFAMWAGILISALIFGALHYLSYNSISEFIAAFVFGILAGYVRMKNNSLYPSIIAHMLVNLLGLLVLAILI